MPKRLSRFQQLRDQAKDLLDEHGPRPEARHPRWRRFVHFWVLVWVSFNRNRCPVRASALAYATLLALIPMLAVAVSITSSVLKKQGEDRINDFIGKMVATLTPPAEFSSTNNAARSAGQQTLDTSTGDASTSPAPSNPGKAETVGAFEDRESLAARKAAAQKINEFIQNTRSGALGITGSVLLIFAAISMLTRIEVTFNDIWGVEQGRSWFMRIILYWGVLTLVPILLVVALGLATGPHLDATRQFISSLPLVGTFLINLGFQVLPVLVLCLTFSAFYLLMPNTRVQWQAGLVGGLVAGLLFHINNLASVLYVSRVVMNSKIYGSLALVPVFMIGVYFSWLIVLLGAQVAYAYQNRSIYAEEKQVENINQRGREFIALRLMTIVGRRFAGAEPPCTVPEMAQEIGVPTRLVREIMQTLAVAGLVIETARPETAYVPARPMEDITCHDILEALRSTRGQELATRDDATRGEVFGEFQRIQEAERKAAASVSMQALVRRAQPQLTPTEPKALVASQ